MIVADYSNAWCVEEREIARLKKNGRGVSKKNRRVIGRAIRHWQRKLKAGKRSISVPVYGKVIFKKHGRPLVATYELPHSPRAVICFDEYSELTERQIASALGVGDWE